MCSCLAVLADAAPLLSQLPAQDNSLSKPRLFAFITRQPGDGTRAAWYQATAAASARVAIAQGQYQLTYLLQQHLEGELWISCHTICPALPSSALLLGLLSTLTAAFTSLASAAAIAAPAAAAATPTAPVALVPSYAACIASSKSLWHKLLLGPAEHVHASSCLSNFRPTGYSEYPVVLLSSSTALLYQCTTQLRNKSVEVCSWLVHLWTLEALQTFLRGNTLGCCCTC
jgi:inorganic triphosphatase YgiF